MLPVSKLELTQYLTRLLSLGVWIENVALWERVETEELSLQHGEWIFQHRDEFSLQRIKHHYLLQNLSWRHSTEILYKNSKKRRLTWSSGIRSSAGTGSKKQLSRMLSDLSLLSTASFTLILTIVLLSLLLEPWWVLYSK